MGKRKIFFCTRDGLPDCLLLSPEAAIMNKISCTIARTLRMGVSINNGHCVWLAHCYFCLQLMRLLAEEREIQREEAAQERS